MLTSSTDGVSTAASWWADHPQDSGTRHPGHPGLADATSHRCRINGWSTTRFAASARRTNKWRNEVVTEDRSCLIMPPPNIHGTPNVGWVTLLFDEAKGAPKWEEQKNEFLRMGVGRYQQNGGLVKKN